MQSSKEEQGEIRKPSSVISAKKQRKTIEWERLEISSRKQRYQGNISCKDGHNKGWKWYGPNRGRRNQEEHTEELYKKDLHDPDNHDGVITYLEPDILECEVKWALGRTIANKSWWR